MTALQAADGRVTIRTGDCRETLAAMPAQSVHCVVTSPPYFGLRDYGCDGQIGLEPTPAEFVAALVAVFREVRRVLREDGTVWLNLGDSYAGTGKTGGGEQGARLGAGGAGASSPNGKGTWWPPRGTGLKVKDIIGIPWRVAFALQDDGWYLRQDIIWAKPNPMPESVRDRCTKAHEYVFLLSKSPRYFFDQAAIAETLAEASVARLSQPTLVSQLGSARAHAGAKTNGTMKAVGGGETRNRRSVWPIATQPYDGAHFATMPPALAEPCILAGCPHRCCTACGAPWVRDVERTPMVLSRSDHTHEKGRTRSSGNMVSPPRTVTRGFAPSCACAAESRPGVVLDPFGGAGTTGLVAARHGRRAILCELNPDYASLARDRIAAEWRESIKVVSDAEPLPLFGGAA